MALGSRQAVTLTWILVFLGAAGRSHADVPLLHAGDLSLDVGAMAQVLATGQYVPDPVRSPEEMYLYLKEGRLRVVGGYRGFTLELEMALGGENTVAAPTPGVSLGLLDLDVNVPVPFIDRSFIKVGQFKVPYSREQLTYSANLLFADRSIAQPAFVVGRDVGLALNLRWHRWTAIAGIFTGGGRDVPIEYLPEELGVPLLAARAGYGDVDDDPYHLSQGGSRIDHKRFAFFANGLYMRDSRIGHSTVLNVKLADKALLLNSGWNPYIASSPLDAGSYYQVGGDAALRLPLGGYLELDGEAEGNYAGYANTLGSLRIWGARVQGALAVGRFAVALRYAIIGPDQHFAYTPPKGAIVPFVSDVPVQEVTPALSVRFFSQRLKVIVDAPILIDVPTAVEPKIGSYVLTQMPNQVSVVAAGGYVHRHEVEAARLLLQARF